jgi:hypothetical protein
MLEIDLPWLEKHEVLETTPGEKKENVEEEKIYSGCSCNVNIHVLVTCCCLTKRHPKCLGFIDDGISHSHLCPLHL